MVALAGPNGSGKTTLVKILSGLFRPRLGEASLDGAPLGRMSGRARARRIAVVSQHIDPRLAFDVGAVVAMGRTPYGRLLSPLSDVDRQAIDAALAAVDASHLSRRQFADLSGGEQQRVILA